MDFREVNFRRFLSGLILACFGLIVLSCSNPVMQILQEKLAEDVEVHLLGEPPEVESLSPLSGAAEVPTSAVLSAVFTAPMDETTINGESVRLFLLPGLTTVSGTVSYAADTKTLRFVPAARLEPDKNYRLEIGTAVKTLRGNSFKEPYLWEFSTRYFHDDEIGINLNYSSADLVLNAANPIYIELYGVPLPTSGMSSYITELTDILITSSGKYRIPKDLIPQGRTEALIFLHHRREDGSFDYSSRLYRSGAAGNLVDADNDDNFSDLVIDSSGEYFSLNETYIAGIGNGYSLTYSDGSPINPDEYENADSTPSSYLQVEQGVYETRRNIHAPDDVDFLIFTTSSTDKYEIRVDTTESSLNLKVGLYALNGTRLAENNGSGVWTVNPAGTPLTKSSQYYLRISGYDGGLGEYKVGWFYAQAPQDAGEPSNNEKAGAVSLEIGRSGAVTGTFHENGSFGDSDWFSIPLDAGKTYVAEIQEDTSYFGPTAESRGMTVEFRLEKDNGDTNTSNFTLPGTNTFYIDDPASFAGTGTYYLKITNTTDLKGDQRPSMRYTLLVTYGPDSYDRTDNPFTDPTNEFDLYNEHGPAGTEGDGTIIPWVPYDGYAGTRRTIYSTLSGETPGQDWDWFRVQFRNNFTHYLIWTEPEPGADGIITEFDIFGATWDGGNSVPNLGGGPLVSGYQWEGEGFEAVRGLMVTPYQAPLNAPLTFYPTPTQGTYFIRVRRSSANLAGTTTGAYRLFFRAGGDNEDNQEPDYKIEVGGVEYGLDETPWLGSIGFSDFTTRNKLADRNEWTSGQTPIRYNTIAKVDYNTGNGEPLGSSPEPDHDYLWIEIPAGATSVNLVINTALGTYKGMPVKATVYKAPNIGAPNALDTIRARDTAPTNEVVTEAELVFVGTYNSQSYFGTYGDHQIAETLSVTAGDVIFIRVERDSDNALPGDSETAEYFLRMYY